MPTLSTKPGSYSLVLGLLTVAVAGNDTKQVLGAPHNSALGIADFLLEHYAFAVDNNAQEIYFFENFVVVVLVSTVQHFLAVVVVVVVVVVV